jgi:fluoride ion exporter CrcB/FEX
MDEGAEDAHIEEKCSWSTLFAAIIGAFIAGFVIGAMVEMFNVRADLSVMGATRVDSQAWRCTEIKSSSTGIN